MSQVLHDLYMGIPPLLAVLPSHTQLPYHSGWLCSHVTPRNDTENIVGTESPWECDGGTSHELSVDNIMILKITFIECYMTGVIAASWRKKLWVSYRCISPAETCFFNPQKWCPLPFQHLKHPPIIKLETVLQPITETLNDHDIINWSFMIGPTITCLRCIHVEWEVASFLWVAKACLTRRDASEHENDTENIVGTESPRNVMVGPLMNYQLII